MPNLPSKAKVVIIGGGIHGLSTAWHLSQKYKNENDVVVLEKSNIAAAASGIACGVVRNNYFQPAMRELMAHSVEVWESDPKAFKYNPVGYLQISPEVMHEDVASIYQQQKAGVKGANWDGVRNYQAANNLKKMKKGDLCFFYHSNIGKEIVGIIEVIKTAFLDKTDKEGRFVAIQVKFKEKLKKPIKLEVIKNTKSLNHLPLIKQSRLSVMPIDYKSWKIIYKMGKV